ncbi:branched-chain amino acid aminotransferase II [Vararia minispora EC-137]|uniref:Branched-chain amino acid aminotransferase II n=1 Tax=Vararia minispora EC-137 TaxID=1314806 RepID=A0ACB8QYB8_9AGAM|nr:branched-chain amino acid aminotransferase II [Vararia minispora EC-137]
MFRPLHACALPTARLVSQRVCLPGALAAPHARFISGIPGQPPLNHIDPSKLKITRTASPKEMPSLETLKFGRNFTDHMLTVEWSLENGWEAPEIKPYGPLQLAPSAMVFHYAQCLFEGLKAYRNKAGKITLFRPELNMARMNRSAERIALPTFDGDALLECMKQLIKLEKNWIPQLDGYSLYIRPVLIGTQESIGISPPNRAMLCVILSPVGPYYPDGFKPVALHGTTEFIRAAPGGTGAYKIGANYAQGLHPQKWAAQLGYVQNLWLSGPEHYLTEVGTMNLFVAFRQPDGTIELVTPPLDGMILPGVTRDSVLSLARSHASGSISIDGLQSKLVVNERAVTMPEVREAVQAGRLIEMFGSGTAAIVSPIDKIGYMGQDIIIPVESDGMGPVSRPLWKELVGRQTGVIPSDWSYVVEDPSVKA